MAREAASRETAPGSSAPGEAPTPSAPHSRAAAGASRSDPGADLSRAGATAHHRQRRAARMAERLRERRERHLERSRPYRVAVVAVGFLVTGAGIVMTGPVPGPGTVVTPIGLAILALEFSWAERLLYRVLHYVDEMSDRAVGQSTRRKTVTAILALAAVAALVLAVIVFEIPLPPF